MRRNSYRMPFAKYSEALLEECLKKLLEEAVDIAESMRREGAKVSLAEVVTAIEIALAYSSVTGQLVCSLKSEPGLSIAKASMAKSFMEERLLEETVRRSPSFQVKRSIWEGVIGDLKVLGLDFGRAVNTRTILTRGGPRVREAYARLKLLGLIRCGRRGEYVVERKQAMRAISRLETLFDDYASAVRSAALRDIMRSGRVAAFLSSDFIRSQLDSIPLERMLDTAFKAKRVGNLRLARDLAREVADRLSRGARTREALRGYELLKEFNMISPEVLASLLASEPRLVEALMGKVPPAVLKKSLRFLGAEALERLIQILSRSERGLTVLEDLIKELDYRALSSVAYSAKLSRPSGSHIALYVLAALAHVEKLLIAALEQSSEAAYDYAMYELDRILDLLNRVSLTSEQASLVQRGLERIAELSRLAQGETPSIAKLLRLFGTPYALLEVLHRISTSPNTSIKMKAKALSRRLLAMYMYSLRRSGRGTLTRKHITPRRGRRLELRKTLRRMMVFETSFLAFVDRKMRSNIVVVVDKSGSMRPYALTAALTALAFSSILRRLVLFDSRVYVYSAPRRGHADKVIDLVLSTSFEGYTNLSEALLGAVKGLKPGTLILVTDLKQTVDSGVGVEEAFHRVRKAGWKVILFLPPSYDDEVMARISRYVLRTFIVRDEKSLEKTLRGVLRLLG